MLVTGATLRWPTSTDSEVPGIVDGERVANSGRRTCDQRLNSCGRTVNDVTEWAAAGRRRVFRTGPDPGLQPWQPRLPPRTAEQRRPAAGGSYPRAGHLRGQADHRRPGPTGRADAG